MSISDIRKSASIVKQSFRSYYFGLSDSTSLEEKSVGHREFSFVPFSPSAKGSLVWIRNLAFPNSSQVKQYLKTLVPLHAFVSSAFYRNPAASEAADKEHKGCDFFVDIDADHFYTPCKWAHDYYYCSNCCTEVKFEDTTPENSSDSLHCCDNPQIEKFRWFCEDCYYYAKKEAEKIAFELLPEYFGVKRCKINFSGHRGFHIVCPHIGFRNLSSSARDDIVSFTKGDIEFRHFKFGLKSIRNSLFGFNFLFTGWIPKIERFVLDNLEPLTRKDLERFLNALDLDPIYVEKFMENSQTVFDLVSNKNSRDWSVLRLTLSQSFWASLYGAISKFLGAKIDSVVSRDVHRLRRLTRSLHGKTGFSVVPIRLEDLGSFSPLDSNFSSDPVVLFEEKDDFCVSIRVPRVPKIKIKGESFGPFREGEAIWVPRHIAVLLVLKNAGLITKTWR